MSFSGSGNTEKPVTPIDLKLGLEQHEHERL